jgi:hypothetical protein
MGSSVGLDRRGVTPAVGKILEVGLVVLFVGLATTVLLGGAVPDYRTAVSAEVGERVLATASGEVERAVPPVAREVEATREVSIPATIRDSGYALQVDGRWLVLDHPHPEVNGRMRLSLPPSVHRVEGGWESGARTVVHVRGGDDGLVVELADREEVT